MQSIQQVPKEKTNPVKSKYHKKITSDFSQYG